MQGQGGMGSLLLLLLAERACSEGRGRSGQVPFLLALRIDRAALEKGAEGRLEASCARATRGRGPPSPGLLTRLGVPVGGQVRKLRAVGDHRARRRGKRQDVRGDSPPNGHSNGRKKIRRGNYCMQ